MRKAHMHKSKGQLTVHVGQYQVDDTTFFDVRACDTGPVLSLCDEEMMVRFTVILDGTNVAFREIAPLAPAKKKNKP